MTLIDINPDKKCDCLQPGCKYCDPRGDRLRWQTEYTYEVILDNMLNAREEHIDNEADDKVIEKYTEEVYSYLKSHFDNLKFETIILALVRCGDAPQLVYDDNGNFAIAAEGMCGINKKASIDMSLICF